MSPRTSSNTSPPLWLVASVLLACVFSIMAYGTFRCRQSTFRDPFTESIIDREPWNKFVDGWGILHFWFFALLAFYFPKHWVHIVVAGILWEIIESLFRDHPFYLTQCNTKPVLATSPDDGQGKNWWYGRWQDIVMNSLGMLCGFWLSSHAARSSGAFIFPGAFACITLAHVGLQRLRQ